MRYHGSSGPVIAPLLLLATLAGAPATASADLESRIADVRAVDEVLHRHRLWPAVNPQRKPSFAEAVDASTIREKALEPLRKQSALERYWNESIPEAHLQAELDRMARDTRDPELLRELFAALGNDADRIVETLVRPLLVDRRLRARHATDRRFGGRRTPSTEAAPLSFAEWWSAERAALPETTGAEPLSFTLPPVTGRDCAPDSWSQMTPVVPYRNHTVVWTGSEMIVWGGNNGGFAMNFGGRYDPATDSWSLTSIGEGVPDPREFHTAVWTGSEMIIWGGNIVGGDLRAQTGARYDPVTDSWQVTSTVGAPPGRRRHFAVWTGSEMIVWGGDVNGDDRIGGRYDPETDSWQTTAIDANTPDGSTTGGQTAVWSGSEMLVWGLLNRSGRYDPATDSWQPISNVGEHPHGVGFVSTWTGSEMVVFGAAVGDELFFNDGTRYDPVTDSWQTMTTVNAPMRVPDELVWTGSEVIAENRAYDPANDTWRAIAAEISGPAIWTGSEAIEWEWGRGTRYDPVTDIATDTATTPLGARAHWGVEGVWTGTEMIVWNTRYTLATDSWQGSTVVDRPDFRRYAPALWTGSEMIVWGGDSDGNQTGGRYDPLADSWAATTLVGAPDARTNHTAVWTGSEMIVWGGERNDVELTGGGRYDPDTDGWQPVSAVGAPGPRTNHSAVWTGDEMIVWGGSGTVAYADGGRYDPDTDSWQPTSTGAGTPQGRSRHASVWTGGEMIVWGGTVSPLTGALYSPLTDSWRPMSAEGAPDPTFERTVIWTGGEMVLWGGERGDGEPRDIGGRYDPGVDGWRPTPTGDGLPPARTEHASVWTGDEIIVWGGWPSPNPQLGGLLCLGPCTERTSWLDSDGDGFGDGVNSAVSCTPPYGYVLDGTDCLDTEAAIHPGAPEVCDQLRNDCDAADWPLVIDPEQDGVEEACDNCTADYNPIQADVDDNGVGDVCDLFDGLIYVRFFEKGRVEWQKEFGFHLVTPWNSYRGDLAVLQSSRLYTQEPGSNALARRDCALSDPWFDELDGPDPGTAAFYLTTGRAQIGGGESSLGTDSSGAERPNDNSCP